MKKTGFSLIELLVAVAIIAVIAAIGYPAYTRYVQTSRRADAIQALANGQAIYEKCYASNFTFAPTSGACATNIPASSANGYYQISTSSTATTYTITATALGAQLYDVDCQTLTIDQSGIKTASNNQASDTSSTCWPK